MSSPPLQALGPQVVGTLLERLLAIADDAVVVTDDAQRIVLFNDGAERMFGWGVAEALGRPLAMLLPPGARTVHENHLRAFAVAPQPARRMGERRDLQGLRRDGTPFDAEASIAHVEFDGRTYFCAILRDVSEARAANRALARSEARFRELAASVPVGIFQADRGGRFVYANERWCTMAGMQAAEAAGEGWLRAVHPADRARVRQAWADAVTGRADLEQRWRFLRPDGSETWVMARAVRSAADADAPGGLLGTVTDVTESHRQALALEQAKAEAEAAARAKSMFLANMSHEIRTPLNAVIGMTTLLLDTALSDDQRDFTRTIRASGESLLEIVNDVLDYSKADVGKLEIEQQAFDLRRCVEDALDLVAPRAVEKRLNLAYLIEDGTPEALLGDAARIRQILVNLLSNAVKFTHQGEVFVAVDGVLTDDGTQRIRFAVQDTGIGIARDQLPRLFQSFTQVDASTTRKYGGTGLGLAISRRLAELMGGTIEVTSTPGQGSTFTATVAVALAPAREPAEFLRRDTPALAGKRLLVVDDNLTNRRILTRLAMLWGMRPSTLPSALEALDRIRHGEAFDVAVLDMSMPGMDGLQLANEIRRQRSAEALPIVMLTSMGQRHALRDAQGAALAAYLPKPIKASQLHATLVGVLQGRGSPAAQAPTAPAPRPAATGRPLRVLVAEDNAINQRVALRLLQKLGYRADMAANGLEVIEAVERQPYDIVLMDIQMPEMDGMQAARWIVQRRGRHGLPRIVAMTANAMPGDREAYLAVGMDGYVAKPIELGNLAEALARAAPPIADEAPQPPGDAVLDPARLDHLRALGDGDGSGLVQELVTMFIADAPGHLAALDAALAAGDAAGLAQVAHRFLSMAQNLGAQRLAALCAELELRSRAQRSDGAEALVAAIGTEWERVRAALQATAAGR